MPTSNPPEAAPTPRRRRTRPAATEAEAVPLSANATEAAPADAFGETDGAPADQALAYSAPSYTAPAAAKPRITRPAFVVGAVIGLLLAATFGAAAGAIAARNVRPVVSGLVDPGTSQR